MGPHASFFSPPVAQRSLGNIGNLRSLKTLSADVTRDMARTLRSRQASGESPTRDTPHDKWMTLKKTDKEAKE